MQVCAEPHIVNFLSKTFQISADSPGRKNHQVCTMLEKQMIFACAVNPTDTEKLFLKLQVCAFVCKLSSFVFTALHGMQTQSCDENQPRFTEQKKT